jgi:hypothetical protein
MAVRALDEHQRGTKLSEIAKDNFGVILATSSFLEVLSAVRSTNVPFTLVVDRLDHATVGTVKGVITSRQLIESMIEDIELFSD